MEPPHPDKMSQNTILADPFQYSEMERVSMKTGMKEEEKWVTSFTTEATGGARPGCSRSVGSTWFACVASFVPGAIFAKYFIAGSQ